MQDLEAQTGLFSDNQWFQKDAALHIVFWNKYVNTFLIWALISI